METLITHEATLLSIAISVARDYFKPLVDVVAYISGSHHRPKVGRTELHSHRALELEVQRVLAKEVRGSHQLVAHLGLPDDLHPTVLIEGTRLSPTAASLGFGNIELVTQRLISTLPGRIPYFFGVNRGGGIIASLLTQRLGLHQKHLLKCDYNPEYRKLFCEERPDVSLAIIVDDAVRSGNTLRAVRKHIQESYPDALIYVLALVVSANGNSLRPGGDHAKLFDLVDYYPWISFNPKTALPWTGNASNVPTEYIDEEGVNQIIGRLLSLSAEELGRHNSGDA